jgi:hypothetical protein
MQWPVACIVHGFHFGMKHMIASDPHQPTLAELQASIAEFDDFCGDLLERLVSMPDNAPADQVAALLFDLVEKLLHITWPLGEILHRLEGGAQ